MYYIFCMYHLYVNENILTNYFVYIDIDKNKQKGEIGMTQNKQKQTRHNV